MSNITKKESAGGGDEITYREDGNIPVGIWLVWLGFFAFAIYYISRWAAPDFLVWWKEAKF